MNINDKEALFEVNEILKYTDSSIVEMLPVKIRDFIQNNMNINSNFKVNENVDLFEQPISQEAKRILAEIYRKYICTNDERKELEILDRKQLLQEEDLKKQIYNMDNLFVDNNNKSINQTYSQNELVEKKEKSIVSKILKKIKSLLKRK